MACSCSLVQFSSAPFLCRPGAHPLRCGPRPGCPPSAVLIIMLEDAQSFTNCTNQCKHLFDVDHGGAQRGAADDLGVLDLHHSVRAVRQRPPCSSTRVEWSRRCSPNVQVVRLCLHVMSLAVEGVRSDAAQADRRGDKQVADMSSACMCSAMSTLLCQSRSRQFYIHQSHSLASPLPVMAAVPGCSVCCSALAADQH